MAGFNFQISNDRINLFKTFFGNISFTFQMTVVVYLKSFLFQSI